jgi:hypothetical protein
LTDRGIALFIALCIFLVIAVLKYAGRKTLGMICSVLVFKSPEGTCKSLVGVRIAAVRVDQLDGSS